DSTGALNDPDNHVALNFHRTDTYEEIAEKLTTALRNANIGLDTTQHLGEGIVQVGGGTNHRIDTSNSSVTQIGLPGVAESLRLHVPALSVSLTIPNGGALTVPDNAKFALGDGVSPPIVFELDDNASGLSPGSDVVVSIVGNETRTELANVVANAIRIQFPSLNVTVGPSGQISLGNSQGYVVDTSQAGGITSTSIANVADMESFAIQVAGSAPVVFEFNNNGGSVTGGRVAINIPTSATVSQVVSAMQSVIGGVASLGLAPSIEPYGVLALNETTMYTVDTSATSVFDTGVPGGAVAIPVQPSLSYTSQFVAGLLIEAINANQPAVDARFRGGGTIYLNGAVAIQGIRAFAVDAVQDLAGNQLQSNQPTGETQFTIILGDVALDYGDAPNTYQTLLANNGARHAQVVGNTLRLGSRVDTEADGQPNAMADGDDGDQFINLGSSGFSLNNSTAFQQSPFTLRVPDGSLALEGTTLVLTSTLGSVTFEFNSNGSMANGVPIAIGDLRPEYYGANDVVDNLVAAIKAQVALNNLPSNTIAKNLNSGVLYLEGLTSVDVPTAVPALSPLVMLNRLPASISVVDGATLVDQQQFTISDGVNPPLVFEFENTTVGNGLTDLAFWEVPFTPTDAATTVAANVASAVTAAVASGRLSGVAVVDSLDGRLQISTASGQEEDDDDGVIFHQPFNPGSQRTQITVEVTDIGLLDAWVDFNQNGIFEDSERIFASVPLVSGTNQLFAATPAGALTGQTYARFRV
ncbi:MAG: hypothetical protein KDA47_24390, partial [Planctomycetales bacterium]|nr:hypothetical protein [Planctomycetales bacterium]